MRSGGEQPGPTSAAWTRWLGIALLAAGLLGILSLLLQPGPSVRADLRLDDYETSWPDHVEVQNASLELLDRTNAGDVDVSASIRNDRSTVEIVGSSDTPPATLDSLVAQLVERDARERLSAPSIAELTNSLADLRNELERIDASDAADPAEAEALVQREAALRSELAAQTVRTETTRSRFVPLSPASQQTPTTPASQWVVIAGLIAGGALLLGRGRTSR